MTVPVTSSPSGADAWLDFDLRGQLGQLDIAMQARVCASPALVIGANGSGKSTLLRAVVGARLPLTGRIDLDGRSLFDSQQKVDLPAHQRRIGYVPQGHGLFPNLSALANVRFGCGRGAEADERALAALTRVEAAHLSDRYPATLSGGEQQRVALARALAIEPDALLLDEPLAALDPGSRRRTRAALAEYLAAAGCPALVVTHDVRDVRALAATVLVMENGAIADAGTASELCARAESDFVSEFFDLPGIAE